MSIRIIMLGDIVGTAGRQAVTQCVPRLREIYQPDLVIANAENTANGSGLTPEQYKKLTAAGVDAITLGDHAFKRVQISNILDTESNIIRPANISAHAAGKGVMKLPVAGKADVYVMTVLGRLFMNMPANDPFLCVDQTLAQLPAGAIVLLEVHAETTSEKQALGWYCNGRVSAVVGTHTHVPTADACILPPAPGAGGAISGGGTAYITDLGMSGPHESILGRAIDRVLKHMSTGMPAPFDVAGNDLRVNGVLIDIDERNRRASHIERIEMKADLSAPPFTASR